MIGQETRASINVVNPHSIAAIAKRSRKAALSPIVQRLTTLPAETQAHRLGGRRHIGRQGDNRPMQFVERAHGSRGLCERSENSGPGRVAQRRRMIDDGTDKFNAGRDVST